MTVQIYEVLLALLYDTNEGVRERDVVLQYTANSSVDALRQAEEAYVAFEQQEENFILIRLRQ